GDGFRRWIEPLRRRRAADPDQPGRGTQARLRDDRRHQGGRRGQARPGHALCGALAAGAAGPDRAGGIGRPPAAVSIDLGRPRGVARSARWHGDTGVDWTAADGGGSMKATWMLRLFPRAWRARYEEEFRAL